ncbi:late embryogenesis abundant protein D-34-like [Canna indica]|uniref:Late embryogenesis abundant protein D-34-like n=1 Tax=Canna indica TaxID=4628 RepID=A0AAQ3L4F0_9LILI|nr:late embryogenesis abundant protein D-34-like [Canna indica]
MSQQQLRRPDQGSDEGRGEPIRYGDVFPVVGDLADQTIAPRDAALMHSAESKALGHTPKGGAASTMESAATRNEQRGVVGHDQFSPTPANQGVSVTQTAMPGCPGQRLVTEFVAGQAVTQYVVNDEERTGPGGNQDGQRGQSIGGVSTWTDKMTIGEALSAAGRGAADKPVEMSDAAAIEAAESAATGLNTVLRGGMAASAQSAATVNARATRDEEKIKLGDVLQDARMRLPDDREVTRGDAERVMRAELRNNLEVCSRPGGVADSMVAAARFNQEHQ